MADTDRVDRLLSWLDEPAEERPGFLTLYFDKVDTAGHHQGTSSAALNQALTEIDAAVARLIEGLKQRGLSDQVDLLVVADHGMTDLSPDRVIYIDDYIAADSVDIVATGAMMGIDPPAGVKQVIEKALLSPKNHMVCRKKQDMPARFHYGSNARVPDILCLADSGWLITTRAEAERMKTKDPYVATHGYDNQLPEMAALFIASGPDFKRGVAHAPFDNVDVYPLMAKLLGLTPEPNDGKLSDVADMLVTR
jgi:predicted AlkP superfamily pyrophosphatase or phosphodiesterase